MIELGPVKIVDESFPIGADASVETEISRRARHERERTRLFGLFPRGSISGLIAIALTTIALPLLFGSVVAAVQMRDLAAASERLVLNGVLATRQTQAIVRQVAAMERAARLYQILGRPPLLEAVHQNRRALEATLLELGKLPDDPSRAQLVATLREKSDGAVEATASTAPGASAGTLRQFTEMAQAAGDLSRLASDQTQRELAQLRAATERLRHRLYWQAGALVPLTLGLILLFTRLIGRPLSEIDAAISSIGHGQLAGPISVRGPSDLKALGKQLEWLRQRLLEIADERNRFLRHMSHELKTPLANIREGSELLIEGAVGGLAPEQREVAGILRDNSLRLQRLIENLLSYSEWQARRGKLEISEFRLRPLVQATIESHQLALAARDIRIDLEVADLQLQVDRAKLRLVIDNLLSNAIKFTPDAGMITLRAAQEDGRLRLDVADTGPGIAPDDREHIFEAFYQGATPAGSLVRGTGIGLSVVQEFVRAQGGTVELAEGEFPGAHFLVRMPMVVQADGVESQPS